MSDTTTATSAIDDKLLPTAKVGDIVYWYDRNLREDPENCRPAMVIKQEGPGRVTLKVFRMGDDMHKQGCCHHDHPVHEQRNAHTTVHQGSWGYRQEKIPPEDYELARLERDKRVAAEQANKEALKAAGTKKLSQMAKS